MNLKSDVMTVFYKASDAKAPPASDAQAGTGAAATAALQQVKALSGSAIGMTPAVIATAEPEPAATEAGTHPAIAEVQDRASAAQPTASVESAARR